MTAEEDERRVREALRRTFESMVPGRFVDEGTDLAVEVIRRSRDWRPHPDGGFSCPWPEEIGSGESRWDGGLAITESGTLRAAIDHVVVNCTVEGDEP